MRLLLLAARLPAHLHNGEDLRIFHLARHLAERHEIDFVGYGSEARQPLSQLFRRVFLLPRPEVPPLGRRTLRAVLRSLSPYELYVYDRRMEALVRSRTREVSYDAVWVPAWELLPIACAGSAAPILFDAMDDGVLEHLREVRCSKNLYQLTAGLKRLVVNYRFEREFFPRTVACVFVSERDARVMHRWVQPRARVAVIHNGVDLEYFRPSEGGESAEPGVVFEGNMGFGPNVDAALRLARDIYPRIIAEMPQTRLWIVGRDPAPAVRALEGSGIVVTGTVEDVRPYVSRASVFVSPMRKGAGIKNKILQAWALGKPVVATHLSCGGLRVRPGENIVVQDTSAAIAAEVVSLLRDRERRCRLGLAARRTVEEHYSWQQKSRELESLLETHASVARGTAANHA